MTKNVKLSEEIEAIQDVVTETDENCIELEGLKDKTLSPSNSWAWNIHKEADTLLHSRIQAFLTFQAFLIAAYFSANVLLQSNPDGKTYGLILCIFGVLAALLFYYFVKPLINGILLMKQSYLLHQPIYKIYYTPRLPSYNIVYGLAGLVILIWMILGWLAFEVQMLENLFESIFPQTETVMQPVTKEQ